MCIAENFGMNSCTFHGLVKVLPKKGSYVHLIHLYHGPSSSSIPLSHRGTYLLDLKHENLLPYPIYQANIKSQLTRTV